MKDEAVAVYTSIYFELCCLIVGKTFFLAHPAERFVLNGEVKVMLITMCSIKSVQLRDGPRERTYIWEISSEPY